MLFAPTPVALYTSEVCLKHEPGWFNPERPERLSGLLEAMRTEWSSEFAGLLSIHEPESDATPEQLLRVHTPAHLARLDDAFGRVGGILTPRVNLDADTIVAAAEAAGVQPRERRRDDRRGVQRMESRSDRGARNAVAGQNLGTAGTQDSLAFIAGCKVKGNAKMKKIITYLCLQY